jgi:hypothetical protein
MAMIDRKHPLKHCFCIWVGAICFAVLASCLCTSLDVCFVFCDDDHSNATTFATIVVKNGHEQQQTRPMLFVLVRVYKENYDLIEIVNSVYLIINDGSWEKLDAFHKWAGVPSKNKTTVINNPSRHSDTMEIAVLYQ